MSSCWSLKGGSPCYDRAFKGLLWLLLSGCPGWWVAVGRGGGEKRSEGRSGKAISKLSTVRPGQELWHGERRSDLGYILKVQLTKITQEWHTRYRECDVKDAPSSRASHNLSTPLFVPPVAKATDCPEPARPHLWPP